MFTNKFHKIVLVLLSFSIIVFAGCSALNMLNNINKLQYRLGNVVNLTVASVNLSNTRTMTDLVALDQYKLTQSIVNKTLPVSFTLNIIASNPNNSNSTAQTNNSSNFDATISRIDWILLIDDRETVRGNVSQPFTVPSGNQSVSIPVTVELDLFKFFDDKNALDLANLALTLAGVDGASSHLKLKIKPTVSIAGFGVPYPNYITIVDHEFREK